MSQDEESSGRVTRGALRRRSMDQDTSIGPGTPKKTAAASAKKGPALDAILETNGTSESPAPKGVNKAVQKLKELEPEKAPAGRRSRATSLTEDNVESAAGGSSEVRRTPRRRASQDVSLTPQTAPAATRRMTRRNSVTSDDGSSVSTPKAAPAKARLNVSVAPPTIVEDDEKEISSTVEADLSDLDIRKLRNRSISNSPVPRGSPTGKNSSIKEDESNTSLSSSSTKPVNVLLQDIVRSPKPPTPSPKPEELSAETSVVEMEPLVVTASNAKLNESVEKTPNKQANNTSQQPRKSISGSAQKSVTFDEAATPERQNQSAYPRTPVPQSAEKSFKFGEKVEEEREEDKKEEEVGKDAETVKSPPEVFEIDETVHESPREAPEQTAQPESTAAAAATITTTTPKTPQKDTITTANDQQSTAEENPLDKSSAKLDQSLANIVEDVRENLASAAADLSMSILGTPAKPKASSHLLPRLREGSCSTPIGATKKLGSPKFVSNTPDGRGQKEEGKGEGEKLSKSWSQAVKGSSAGKGIDVFSVRKQEEQERKDEEAKKLNESLKEASAKKGKKSPKKKKVEVEEEEEDDDEDEVGVSELLGGDSSQESNFLDDEAMEVDGEYESGDSMDSEERQEMEENEIPEHGETIGSEDSENDDGSEEDEEGDDDSFIAPEDEEDEELLDGTGDDLSSESEQDKSKPKKRKRIIQVEESSDEEKEVSKQNLSTVSLDHTTTASENSAVEVTKSPKKTPAKDVEKSPKKTPSKTVEQSPKKSPVKQPTPAKEPAIKSPAKQDPIEPPKSRKSLPAAPLISADFYSPAAKKAKRATINVLANGTDDSTAEKEPQAKPTPKKQPEGLLANPAALALAKKNKRQSLDQAATSSAKPESKRASLPMKLPEDKPLDKSLVKQKAKKQQDVVVEEEPMEVDQEEEEEEEDSDGGDADEVEQVVPQKKRKVAKDLSEFDTDAILSRCNEVLRADKERKKQSATAKQKKKDEKRRQREQAEGEGDEDDEEKEPTGADSGSPDKKKKKKKKPINYMLEELGETREEQVARALKRKLALLEVKRERKKAKKAAKLQRQLNKENQDGESGGVGIGAKFEKKAKKKDKKSVVEQLVTEPVVEVPKVKLAVSAFQAYKEQIEELQKDQGKGKKKKQLKEKNQQQQQQQQQPPTAVEEVKAALQVEPAKAKKEKKKVPEVVAKEVAPVEAEKPKKKKKHEEPEVFEYNPEKPTKTPAEIMAASLAEQKKLDDELAQIKRCITEPIPKIVKKPKTAAEQRKLDEDLAKLKQVLSDPSNKIVKKQKLIHQEKPTVTCPEVESTPPRKLKALARLESGFTEEAVTPEAQKIKRNHGFREEPVTPKPVGFKVSAVLPTGQQELAQRAALTKKHRKKSANANRIRPEDVQEPKRALPLPVWTRSGTFDVEELTTASGDKKKPKKAKSFDDGYIPVNGTSGKTSTEFLVKPLSSKKETSKKANRIDLATVDDEMINFKKQAIFGKTAHLREKKSKH